AGHAPTDRGVAAVARAGISVPNFGGGDRRRPRARLSHLPGAPLSFHGCHPALRRLDHPARLSHGFRAGMAGAPRLRLGLCGTQRMSAISLRDVWVEYGEQIVLECVNLQIAAGTFLSVVGPSGAGKSTFLRLILGQEGPSRGAILIDGKPLPDEPGPDRGVVFQRYSVFPHLTVLGNVLIGFEFAGSPLLSRFTLPP